MNVLFKISAFNDKGVLVGSVLEQVSFLSIERFDEAKSTKVIELLTQRLEDVFRVTYENGKAAFTFVRVEGEEANDVIIINRDADLKYLMHIYPIRKLASGSYFLPLSTHLPTINKDKSSDVSLCKDISTQSMEGCCIFQCSTKIKHGESILKNQDESKIVCYFQYFQNSMAKLQELISQLMGLSEKLDFRQDNSRDLQKLESSIHATKIQLQSLGKQHFNRDLFKEESLLIDESVSKIVEINQPPVGIKSAFEVFELLEDSAPDDVKESPNRTGNGKPTTASDGASSAAEATRKKRKVKKRSSVHHGEDANNVVITPSEINKDKGMSHGSPTGVWSITDLENKMSNIKVDPSNSRHSTAKDPPKQELMDFPFHQDPVVSAALESMLAMGYDDEGGLLTRLLENNEADVTRVLEILEGEPGKRSSRYYETDSYFLT